MASALLRKFWNLNLVVYNFLQWGKQSFSSFSLKPENPKWSARRTVTQCVILYPVCLSSLFPCPLLLTIFFLISLGYFIKCPRILDCAQSTSDEQTMIGRYCMEFQNKFSFLWRTFDGIHGEWSASQVLRPEGQLEIPAVGPPLALLMFLPHFEASKSELKCEVLRPSGSYLLFVSLVFASIASSNFLDVSHSWINPWQVMCFAPKQLLKPEGQLL